MNIESVLHDYEHYIEAKGRHYAYKTGVEREDALQSAYEGFIRAWASWDPEQSTLKTWSYPYIRESLRRCFEESQRGPHVPARTRERVEAGTATWETSLAVQTASQPVLSLDAPLFTDPDTGEVVTLGETLSLVSQQPTTVSSGLIDAVLDQLSPKEREVIEMTYGLGGHYPATAREIAEVRGVSERTVENQRYRSMSTLRHNV